MTVPSEEVSKQLPGKKILGTLSPRGWVIDNSEKLDHLLSYMFAAEIDQSYHPHSNITDINSIFAEYPNNIVNTLSGLETSIGRYLGKYFDEVSVSARNLNEINGNNSNKLDVLLEIRILTGGIVEDHPKVLAFNLPKFLKVIDYSNYGVVR